MPRGLLAFCAEEETRSVPLCEGRKSKVGEAEPQDSSILAGRGGLTSMLASRKEKNQVG